MRLIVYNIRYGAGIGRRFHLPVPYSGYLKPTNGHFGKIVDFIKSVNPDIVGLIEVDFGSYRVEKFNQAETIARELNHQVVCKSKYAEASMARKVPVLNKQGNAILTGLPIVARRYHFFNEGVKRLVIEVELQESPSFSSTCRSNSVTVSINSTIYTPSLPVATNRLSWPEISMPCGGTVSCSFFSPPAAWPAPTS